MTRRSSLSRWTRGLLVRGAPRLFARLATPDTEELGHLGEELAARALAARGWVVVGRRLQTPWAEVDVVAVDGQELVCVEVKAGRIPDRSGPTGGASSPELELRFRPGWRLDRERLARLAGASRWLARRLSRARGIPPGDGGRVDLVEVVLRGYPPRIELHHHRRLHAPLPAPPRPVSR